MGRLTRAVRAVSRRRSNPSWSPLDTSDRTSSRARIKSSRTSSMAAAFSRQMSGQMPGWPAATRVMSRKPPAAKRSTAECSSERAEAMPIRVAAVR